MKKNFSTEFSAYVGEKNIFSGELFSAAQYVDIVRANVEILLSKSCRIMDVSTVENLYFVKLAFKDYFAGIDMQWDVYRSFPISGDPRVHNFNWKILEEHKRAILCNVKKNTGNGFVSLYSVVFGVSELTALNNLAKINKIKKDDLFCFRSNCTEVFEADNESLDYSYIPAYIELDSGRYRLEEQYPLQDCVNVKGVMLLYRSDKGMELVLPCFFSCNSNKYPAPCRVSNNIVPPKSFKDREENVQGARSYCLLGQRGVSYLLNMYKFTEMSEESIVLLCESSLLALKIQCFIDKCGQDFRSKYLVTTWYGGCESINDADFSYLHKKNVVFLPEVSVKSYSNLSLCHKKCTDKMVGKFEVLICLFALKRIPRSGDITRMNNLERLLAENSVSTSDLNEDVFASVVAKAVSFDECMKIMKEPRSISNKSNESPGGVEFPISIDELSSLGNGAVDMSYDSIVQPEKITIVIGPNNSGKSMFLMSVLRAIADGRSVFGIQVNKKRRVLLIDGETGKQDFVERNQRVKSALKSSGEAYDSGSFHVEGMALGKQFDFSEETWRNLIENLLSLKPFDVVAFDNLNSLVPGHVNCPVKISNFFVWLRKLEIQYGIAIVLAHHTKDERSESKRSSGSKEIDEKCQTIIAITGKNELEKLKDNEVPPELVKYKYSKGALFQVHVKKCKNVHKLEGEVFYCHLPLDVESPAKGPGWICFHDDSRMASTHLKFEHNVMSSEGSSQRYLGLTHKEHRVMIELAHKYDSFPRGFVDKLLGCCEETSRQILKSLIKDHVLIVAIKGGKGMRNTVYGLHKNDKDQLK